MDMDIYIDGEIISDIIASEGFQRSFKTVEGPNGGTTLNGKTRLDVLSEKNVFKFNCLPLSPARYNRLLRQLAPQYVTVMLVDPDEGTSELTMFASKPEGQYDKLNGAWRDLTFSLEEQ